MQDWQRNTWHQKITWHSVYTFLPDQMTTFCNQDVIENIIQQECYSVDWIPPPRPSSPLKFNWASPTSTHSLISVPTMCLIFYIQIHHLPAKCWKCWKKPYVAILKKSPHKNCICSSLTHILSQSFVVIVSVFCVLSCLQLNKSTKRQGWKHNLFGRSNQHYIS